MTIQVSLGLWKPHVQTAIQKLNSLWPSTSIGTYVGHDPDRSLAADLMIPAWNTTAGNAFGWVIAKAIWAMREELGVHYVIFDGKIISQTRPGAGWLPYFDRNNPNPSRSHKNHVHVSWYSTPPKGYKPSDGTVWIDLLVDGVKDSASIALVQKALGVPQTRTWDAVTKAAAEAFQRSLGDVVDGYLGKLQVTALMAKAGLNVLIRTDPSGQSPIVKPPKPPAWTWDGRSFPGADRLRIGAVGPWVTLLGQRLVAHGYTGYTYGPGAEYGPRDDEGVVWFKRKQGWSGGPRTGKTTWDLLMKPPVVKPPVDEKPPKEETSVAVETIMGLNILRRTDTVAGRKRWPARKPLLGKHLRTPRCRCTSWLRLMQPPARTWAPSWAATSPGGASSTTRSTGTSGYGSALVMPPTRSSSATRRTAGSSPSRCATRQRARCSRST